MPLFKATGAAVDDGFASVALQDGASPSRTKTKTVAITAIDDGSKPKFILSENAELWELRDGNQFVVDPGRHVSSRIVKSLFADGKVNCETRSSIYVFSSLKPMCRTVASFEEVEREKEKIP